MFALNMNDLGGGGVPALPPGVWGVGSGRRGGGGGKEPPFPAGSLGSPSCVLALCCGPGKSKSKDGYGSFQQQQGKENPIGNH